MAKLFYTNIDLKGNQLVNGVIHNATEAPSKPSVGQVYYNTDDNLMYQCVSTDNDGNGTWVVVGGSVADLESKPTLVVTGSSTEKGTAKLNTTALKDMKVGVGLQNLTGVTTDTTLEGEFQAIDTALQEVKTTYVKAGSDYVSGQLLVAGVDGAIKTASTTGYSINDSSFNQNSNTDIPTSKQIANYIGTLAGGITYQGTVDGTNPLPTNGVEVGDAYAVAADGEYADQNCNVGDLIICKSISGTTPKWSVVPINFTVEDKKLRNFAPQDGIQTIAVVDGQHITMSLQAITIDTSGRGNVVTGVSADDSNKLTIAMGNALTTITPSSGTGVVTGISSSDNQTVNVTYTSLAVDAPTNIHYVTSVSQAANGKVALQGTTFDSSITTNPSTTNAPTSNAVKDYVDGKINDLNGDATIASVNDDNIVTLKAGITEENGVISNSGSDIELAKVAKTGKAEDVETTAISNGTTTIPAGTVQSSLEEIASQLNAAVAGSVTSFGGKTGVIEVGNGLKMTDKEDAKSEVSTNVTGYIVNNKGTDNKALDIDSTKVDSSYNTTGNVGNLATVATVAAALNTLNATVTNNEMSKTLATLTETNGKIAATFEPISITSSQINDLDNTYSADGTVAVTGKAVKAALETLDVDAFALSNGGNTSIEVYGISETDGKIKVDETKKQTWNFDGTYNVSENKIALQSTVTNALGTLNGTHNVVTISKFNDDDNDTTQKIEFFNGKQTKGLLETTDVTETLYISNAVSTTNPIITKSDLSGIVGAMVYKGTVDKNNNLPDSPKQGWVYMVAADGTYAEKTCETGDMIVYNGTSWDVINGENQVTNAGATITAGAGTATTIAAVDGTDITAKVSVTSGNAKIASIEGNVVTIKTGVTQIETSGTIENSTGNDIKLAAVAATGAANELTVTSANYGGSTATTNAQTALNNLASAITDANITIDGFKGAIKTGNGLTHVTANNGSFGIKIDSTNNNGLSVGENGLAMAKATGSTFGTVNVTTGNGLTLTNGVVAYAHNTDEITVASKSGNIITINSILTPDASDNITTSDTDKINLAAVAATGAANELTVTSGTYGGSTYTTNAQTALDNLASSAVYVHKQDLSFNDGETATIEILDADLLESAITEIRDNTNNVVECDVTYNSETKITVGINGSLPTGTSLYAIVHYKKKA